MCARRLIYVRSSHQIIKNDLKKLQRNQVSNHLRDSQKRNVTLVQLSVFILISIDTVIVGFF